MSAPDTQLQALIERAASGDVRARAALIDHACERFLRLTRKMFHDGFAKLRRWEQTDDVFQAAMLRLHAALVAVRVESVRHFLNLGAVMIRRTLLDCVELTSTSGVICVEMMHAFDRAGARFVEVTTEYVPFFQWDTHGKGHETVAKMHAEIDRPIARLIRDLAAGGDMDREMERLPSEAELRIILDRSQSRGLFSFRRLLWFENVFQFGQLRVVDEERAACISEHRRVCPLMATCVRVRHDHGGQPRCGRLGDRRTRPDRGPGAAPGRAGLRDRGPGPLPADGARAHGG